MGDSLIKIELLRSRCTPFAEEFLRDLEKHPHFHEILDALINLDGLITRFDIEQAFMEMVTRDRK